MSRTQETGTGEETMKFTLRACISFLAGVALLSLSWLQPSVVQGGVCQEGTGLPPFLSAGADPNLLLLLDNSGSMLDLAYVDETKQCFDDTYDNSEIYTGYFDKDSWYSYDFITDKRFEVQASEPAVCSGGAEYFANDASGSKYVCVDLDVSGEVASFVATGNFMNWVASSKFDIQKEILTGGKYDSVNENLQMESRGCMNKRFVKQVSFAQPDYKLALGVRGSMEVYETWLAGTAYTSGTVIIYGNVLYKANTNHTSSDEFTTDSAKWDEYKDTRWYPNNYYPANTAVYDVVTDAWYWTQLGGTSANVADATLDTAIDWVTYDGTSIEIFSIEEDGFADDACQLAIDLINGLTGTDADGDTDNVNSSLGQIKQATEDCMGFDPGGGNTVETARKSSFNHVMQECWYYNKFGIWQPGAGTVNSMKTSCENVYDYMNPTDITPWDSAYVCTGTYQPEDDKSNYGYVGRCWEVPGAAGTCEEVACAVGESTTDPWDEGDETFVCDADGTYLMKCLKNNCNALPATKPGDWAIVEDCTTSGGGDIGPDWTNDDFYYFDPCTYNTCMENDALLTSCTSATLEDFTCGDWSCKEEIGDGDNLTDYCYAADSNGDLCVEQAIKDFCNIISVPEVIDPSDATTSTGEVWNTPAFLTDGGIIGQLNLPLATMRGYVELSPTPEGVLHSVADSLRIGAMAFHDNGAKTECADDDLSDAIVKYCPSDNEDGARLISPIKSGVARTGGTDADPVYHIDDLTVAINGIRATAWTPLAEAVYTALGYYGQKGGVVTDLIPGYKLGDDDYKTEAEDSSFPDPVQYWCQENYLLVITEGASTADINPEVLTMLNSMGYEDGTVPLIDEAECVDADGNSVLYGSTYLDDLTYFGQQASVTDLYLTPVANPGQILNDDLELHDKQNITTYIVSTGVLRDDGSSDECNPATIINNAATNGGTSLLTGENPDQLDDNLTQVLSDILSRASAGSAASVISSSRSGSGAVYQAIFWPELTDNQSVVNEGDENNSVTWVGDVHSLFMSSGGLMYEDTNTDGKLVPTEDLNNNGTVSQVTDIDAYGEKEDLNDDGVVDGDDKRVIFYYSENANKTRGCYNITEFLTSGFVCPDDPADTSCGAGDDCVEIQDVNYLWSASNQLRAMDSVDRKIFTWNDANNNGKVDAASEWFELNSSVPWTTLNTLAAGASPARGPVTEDFLTSSDWLAFVDNDNNTDAELENDALNALVTWTRGDDQLYDETTDDNLNGSLDKRLRSRQFYLDKDSETKEWRLGDIIHSTPIVVARPAEAYHYIYRDRSYSDFSKKWAKRRNMIYFGANDGMLHAVNGGFYFEHLNQFCCSAELDADGNCVAPVVNNGTCTSGAALGDELWAYIPHNLQPHLKCLTDPEYDHKYFVDQKPRIFDVQIFTEETACRTSTDKLADSNCVHAGGWGTILVGSMRFGGAPVLASDLNGVVADTRELTSSFFILDITNPEADPVLLGEMTRTTEQDGGEDKWVDLNYTTSSPTLLVTRDDTGGVGVNTAWYLVMGNGPTALDGSNDNDEQGKIAVLALENLVGKLGGWNEFGIPQNAPDTSATTGFRIPNKRPSASEESGVFLIPRTATGEPSYVSDLITVDFDIENQATGDIGAMYKSDAVYFGTTDGTDFANYPAPHSGQTYWDGGGRLFRLVTKVLDVAGAEEASTPSDWAAEWSSLDNDPIRMLVDAQAPITAAPSVGFDGNNFWVYAGTGRFYDRKDKTDDGWYDSGFADNDDRNKISFFGIREPVDVSTDCYDGILTWDTINWNIHDNDNYDLDLDGIPGERGLMQVDNFLVAETETSKYLNASYMECANCVATDDPYNPYCVDRTDCFPVGLPVSTVVSRDNDEDFTTVTTFDDLEDYIAGVGCASDTVSTGIDGWYRDFHQARERNLGQAALLGGLLTYTGYQPYNDVCQAEGQSFLYGVYYKTGTAWPESVFGTFTRNGEKFVLDNLSLGRGLATTPSMHVGTGDGGATAFIQTSTGEIIEVKQENLPIDNVKSGRTSWSDRCDL